MARKILTVNGVERRIIVSAEESLANVLRSQLRLTGTKVGCGGDRQNDSRGV
jgi:aldehyde oxidoreductase